jgi:hypothetical protein
VQKLHDAEVKKKVEEQKRLEEKKIEVQKRLEEKKVEEQKRLEEKKVEVQKRLEEKKVEVQNKLEEKKVEEQKRLEEKKVEVQKRYDAAAALSIATQKTISDHVQKLHADAEVMKKVGEQKEYDEKKVEEQKRYDGAAALSNATQKTTSYTVQNFPADTEVKKNIEVQNCYDDVAAQSIAPQKSSTITVHKKFNADTELKKTVEEQEMNESTAALSLEPQKASSVLVQNKPRGETRDKIKKKTEVRNTALPIATQRDCSYPVQKKTDEKKKLKKQNTSDFSAALLSAPKNTSIHLSPSLPHAETGEKKKNKTFFLVNISRWLKSKTKVLKENVSGHIAQDGKSCKKGAEIRDELANSVQGGAAGLVPKFKFAPRIFVSKPREPETENVQLEPRPDPLYLSFMKGNASDQNLPKDQICKKRGAQEPAECPRKNESVPVKPVQTDTITHSV